MECPYCLKENQESIKKLGYDYSFIHNPIYSKTLSILLKYFFAFSISPCDS